MDKLNICVFSRQTFWQGVKGGMEIHGKLLSEGMVKNGNEVSVISTRHPSGKVFEVRNGVNMYYLENTIFGSRRNGWPKESVRKFINLHKKKPFDVIWSQSFDSYGLTFVDKANLRIPVIPILQGCIQQELVTFSVHIFNVYKQPMKMIRTLAGLFYSYFAVQKKLLSYADLVITPSFQVPNDIKKWFGERVAEKCVTIFNGINTKHFYRDDTYRSSIREKYGISEKTVLLLSAGRLVYEKGHQVAIDVLYQIKKTIPNVKLMIVGDGVELNRLKAKVAEKKLDKDVIFTGFVENKEAVKYYNSADIFLMPTLREEGLPFVVIEVMACQKPVIASYIGGNISTIDDKKNGFLVRPGNINEMAAKALALINNPRLIDMISVEARKKVINNFSVEKMVDKTIDVMTSCIK